MIRSEDNRDQSPSCQKSRRIGIFLGGGPSKNGTHIINPVLRYVKWKKFREDTPTSPEVIVAHTMNFRPNFKFSRLNFLGGTPVPVGVCVR